MGLFVATKAFFKLLLNRKLCQDFQQLLDGQLSSTTSTAGLLEEKSTKPKPESVRVALKPVRSDAITLLAALQREARLLDIVREPLDVYSDSQIGAAARDVLKNSGAVLDRMFGLEPLTKSEDGSKISTPSQFDPAQFRLLGNVSGSPPYSGSMVHHGWKATRCEVPQWTGKEEVALVIAPIEIEI